MAESFPTFGTWKTVEKLGQGGMCTVWRVFPGDGVGVDRAVKVLLDQSDVSIARFVQEAALLKTIHHPNILRVHEIAAESRPPWIVLDLLAGKDLEESFAEGPLEPDKAAMWFADLAAGLQLIHEKGIRHRDIKPANIMVGQDGVPRLIDFGIAKQAGSERQTAEGYVVGTAQYLPPEIFTEDDANAVQQAPTSDVYALGQALCEALVARHVHPQEGGAVVVMREKTTWPNLDPRKWRPTVPEGLAKVVMRATAQEPTERTPTAKAFEADLRGWLGSRREGQAAPVSRLDVGGLTVPGAPLLTNSLPVPPAAPKGLPTPPSRTATLSTPSATTSSGPGVPLSPMSVLPTGEVPRGTLIPDSDFATDEVEAAAAPVASPAPSPEPPAVTTEAAAPGPSRAGGCLRSLVALFSTVGIAGAAVVVGVVIVLGLLVLWVGRPRPRPWNDPEVVAVWQAIYDHPEAFQGCPIGSTGEVVLRFRLKNGQASDFTIPRTNVHPDTGACLAGAIQGLSLPTGFNGTIEVPITVK